MNNESILQNEILRKYKLELSKLTSYLKNDLHDLEIKAALVYGSSTYNDVFIEGVSDIDIIAYTDKLETMSPKEIIKIVKKTKIDFKDKEPTVYVDHIGYRIEFYIKLPTISFDITLLPYTIPNFNKKEIDASYDSLEMLIGALYENSIVLFGKRPMEDIVKIDFKDKEPTIYVDHIGYRIEFYIKLPTISFDITLLPYTIPNFNKKETDASYDSLEMLIGALYENSIVLFGKRPMEDIVQKEFYPFYSESLRKKD